MAISCYYINNDNLYNALHHQTAVDYTFVNNYANLYSTIDPIFMSKNFSAYINSNYTLCEEIENQSDHDHVILSMKINFTKNFAFATHWKTTQEMESSENHHSISLSTKLDRCLSNIDYPVNVIPCKNLDCQSISHFGVIHKLYDDIIPASIEASEVIPNTTVSKINTIPDWDSSENHKKEIALFWRSIWISMNSPRDG